MVQDGANKADISTDCDAVPPTTKMESKQTFDQNNTTKSELAHQKQPPQIHIHNHQHYSVKIERAENIGLGSSTINVHNNASNMCDSDISEDCSDSEEKYPSEDVVNDISKNNINKDGACATLSENEGTNIVCESDDSEDDYAVYKNWNDLKSCGVM